MMENSNEVKMTPELMELVKACKSAEELVKLAADNGIELNLADAEKYFAEGSARLSDDDLSKVAGGARYRF